MTKMMTSGQDVGVLIDVWCLFDCVVIGQLQTTIGKAQLLINQKFKQFRELCNKNLRDKLPDSAPSPVGEFVTRDDDLAGFWDMVCLQIDDIHKMFNLLDEIRKNKWTLIPRSDLTNPSNDSHIHATTTNGKSNGTNHLNGASLNGNRSTTNGSTVAANNIKKTVTQTSNLVKKRTVPPVNDKTSTITIDNGNSTGLTTPTAKTASQLKAEASRQRLMEAKKNAFKQKKEAEERLLKEQENGVAQEDNQFFSISS